MDRNRSLTNKPLTAKNIKIDHTTPLRRVCDGDAGTSLRLPERSPEIYNRIAVRRELPSYELRFSILPFYFSAPCATIRHTSISTNRGVDQHGQERLFRCNDRVPFHEPANDVGDYLLSRRAALVGQRRWRDARLV